MVTLVRGMEVLLAGSVHMAIAGAQMLECNSPWQWMCSNGECIAQYDLCNGIAQCSDASDEVDCALRSSQQSYMGVPREEQMRPSTSRPTAAYSSTGEATPFKMLMMDTHWFAIIGIAFLVFIAFAYIHYRKRKASMRNRAHGLRGDNNSDNDEDDLLISALYS